MEAILASFKSLYFFKLFQIFKPCQILYPDSVQTDPEFSLILKYSV